MRRLANLVLFGLAFCAGAGPADEPVLSERGTDSIRAFYAEMGMPRAAELMEKAAFNSMYRPNGATALALRIATSLSRP